MNKEYSEKITKSTKEICTCSFVSIILIILFILSPLNNFIKTSIFMKIIVLILLGYSIYLNILQTNSFTEMIQGSKSDKIKTQVNTNLICSYVFTLFLSILLFFVLKSFF